MSRRFKLYKTTTNKRKLKNVSNVCLHICIFLCLYKNKQTCLQVDK